MPSESPERRTEPKIEAMPIPALPQEARKLRAHTDASPAGVPTCIICGGTDFASGPSGRKSRTGAWPRCKGCQSLERHRLLRKLWIKIPEGLLSRGRVLQFSPDLSVLSDWFGEYELSIFSGTNSIDMQNISRPDDHYDVIICNHVLEHIPDDRKAFQELLRVLSPTGFLEITVPNPFYRPTTDDWGYPKPEDHEHFRVYGADIIDRLKAAAPEALLHYVVSRDDATGIEDYVYFWTKSTETIENLKSWLGPGAD